MKHNPDDHGPGGLLRRGNGNGWTDVHGPAVEEHDVSDTQANTRSWPESLRQALEDLRAIPHLGVWAGLGAAMAIGLWVRLTFILANDFPLNDGGMFYTMALDIQRAGFALPEFTTYNLNGIPFAYPPLGLYVAAIVEAVTPLDMLGVTRFLPLLFNILTIGAVYFLARAMLVSTAAATVAAIAFALLPRSYTWLIVGGGLTRSPALLFAVLGILFVYLFYTRRQWKFMAPAAVLPGLAMLTHPEVGWFTIFTYVLLFLLHGLHKEGLLGSALAAAGTLAITAPWWGTVISRHGLEPLLAAAGTGNHDLAIQMVRQIGYLYFTEEPY
ncbi:MAG: glycosyltransferase family 39 protein, partial [Dehalococcoidia bacterium]